jgi:nitrogen regulatory protein PII
MQLFRRIFLFEEQTMKLIVAIVREYHLETVQPELERHGWSLTSVSQVLGGSRDAGYTLIYREREVKVSRPRLRLELIVDDFETKPAVEVIRASTAVGCPGKVSDAKIMVMSLEDVDAPRSRERATVAASNGKRDRHAVAVGS